jgi:hypothetical protein
MPGGVGGIGGNDANWSDGTVYNGTFLVMNND